MTNMYLFPKLYIARREPKFHKKSIMKLTYSGMEVMFTGDIPGLDINLAKVLHGEHYFKISKPLQSEAKLTNTLKIQVLITKETIQRNSKENSSF